MEGEVNVQKCTNPYYHLINSALDHPECPRIDENEKRIKFLLEFVGKNTKFMYNLRGVGKNSETAADFRIRGNRCFTSNKNSNLDEAVEEYTKSVTHAPKGSQELALAYANRSAALFKARLISDCLLDIERAFQNNYPDNLKAKLYLRRAMCLQTLHPNEDSRIKKVFTEARKWSRKMNEKDKKNIMDKLKELKDIKSADKSIFSKWETEKFLPKLSPENSRIPGLSDAVEIQYSKKYGRHVVATRNIKPGEVLAVQKAYAKAVLVCSRYKICWNCGEQTWASVPCENCVNVVYCSETCKEKGNLEHLDFECPVIGIMIGLKMSDGVFLPLKLLLKAHKEVKGCIATLRSDLEKIDSEKNPLLKGFTKNVLDPSKFSSAYCLETHMDEKTIFKGVVFGDVIMITYLLATKTFFFGTRMKSDLVALASNKHFIFVVGLLRRVTEMTRINNFLASFLNVKEGDQGFRSLVPALSFFNHSCNSMITRTDHGDYMVNTACFPIKKGEQIFDNYGPSYLTLTREKRQSYFSANHCFSCDCEACENDWSEEAKTEYRKTECSDIFIITNEILRIREKCKIAKNLAKSFGRTHDHVYDVTKDVADIVNIIEECDRLQFDHNSLEIILAKQVLSDLLILTKNRFLSLD